MSLRSASGHVIISNISTLGLVSTVRWAISGIMKVNADRANLGVICDMQFDGGGDAAACYYDLEGFPGGTDVAGAASILAGAPNTGSPVLQASRPPVGDWFGFFLDQFTDGGNIRFGWINLSAYTGAWNLVEVLGLTTAQATAVTNTGVCSNSNPVDADVTVYRGSNTPLDPDDYLKDLKFPLSRRANLWDYLLLGAGAANWREMAGKGAIATADGGGGGHSQGTLYDFPFAGRRNQRNVMRPQIFQPGLAR